MAPSGTAYPTRSTTSTASQSETPTPSATETPTATTSASRPPAPNNQGLVVGITVPSVVGGGLVVAALLLVAIAALRALNKV
jgi:hypothetical protein